MSETSNIFDLKQTEDIIHYWPHYLIKYKVIKCCTIEMGHLLTSVSLFESKEKISAFVYAIIMIRAWIKCQGKSCQNGE